MPGPRDLTFELRTERGGGSHHQPDFERNREFQSPSWRRGPYQQEAGFEWLSVRLPDRSEVARVLVQPLAILGRWTDAEPPSRPMLEITLLEVARSRRRSGIGRAVVEALIERYPASSLVLTSQDEQSHQFWSALGWSRHEKTGFFAGTRPLFIHRG